MVENFKICGCGTALVTPFLENGKVDFDAFRLLVKRQIENGIHFLVPLGTTAETPCLSDDEKMEILRITVEESKGRVPVIAGVSSNCTDAVKRNITILEPFGADAYLVAAPYYNKPTQEGLFRHFSEIAAFSPKPIVLYNVPGRTGVNIAAETTIRLSNVANVAAVKEASGNYAQISNIIRNANPEFKVFSGNDDETLSLMATGAAGVVSVVANVMPRLMCELVEALQRNNLVEARNLHHKLFPLCKGLFVETNPIPAKAALAILGLARKTMRLPLTESTEKTDELLRNILAELK